MIVELRAHFYVFLCILFFDRSFLTRSSVKHRVARLHQIFYFSRFANIEAVCNIIYADKFKGISIAGLVELLLAIQCSLDS